MTRITIALADEVADRVRTAAAARGVSPEELAGEILAEVFPPRRKLGFIGIGSSAQSGGSIAEGHKQIRDHLDEKAASDG